MPINGGYSSLGLKRHRSMSFPSTLNKEKFMNKFARTLCAISYAATLVSALCANGMTAAAQEPQGGPPSGAQERPTLPFPASREPEIKPYDRVITKDAKSDEGVFTVHRGEEKLYYEIPKNEFLLRSAQKGTREGSPGGQRAGEHHAGRRRRRSGAGHPSGPGGAPPQPLPAARGGVRRHRRPERAIPESRQARHHPPDHQFF